MHAAQLHESCDMAKETSRAGLPKWFSLVAGLGLAWNVFDIFAAFGLAQVAVLTTVMAIAAGLLWISTRYLAPTTSKLTFVPSL